MFEYKPLIKFLKNRFDYIKMDQSFGQVVEQMKKVREGQVATSRQVESWKKEKWHLLRQIQVVKKW